MTWSRRTSTIFLAALLARAPATARAEGPPDLARAEALYDEGRRAFDLGEYADAIARWKASYMLSSAPQLLFNVGQAYRLSGDCAQANRFYETYERAAPHPSNAAELAAARAKCAGVAATHVPTPPRPSPVIAAPAPTAAPTGPRFRLASAITLGVGGAAGVASIVYALRARDRAATIAGQPAGTPWSPALDDAQRAGHAAATRGRIFGVVGAAALVTGASLWWIGRRHGRVHVDVAITPGRGEASVTCAF